jgi:nucleotide-binding universal stress UspA family protein
MRPWSTIVVGVDGSPCSRAALTWAAAEAARHGAQLVALRVWEPPLLPAMGSGSVPRGNVPDLSEPAAEDLVQVIEEELGVDPPVPVHPWVKQGNSVSQHVTAYAKCPVTVVR